MVCCGGVGTKWSAGVVLERNGLLGWSWDEMDCCGGVGTKRTAGVDRGVGTNWSARVVLE